MISLAKYIWYYYNHRVRFVMYQSHLTNFVITLTGVGLLQLPACHIM